MVMIVIIFVIIHLPFSKKFLKYPVSQLPTIFKPPSFIIAISKTTIIKVIDSSDRFRQSHNYYCKNPPYTQQTKNSVFSLSLFLLTDKIIHELSRPPARTLQNLERKNHHQMSLHLSFNPLLPYKTLLSLVNHLMEFYIFLSLLQSMERMN